MNILIKYMFFKRKILGKHGSFYKKKWRTEEEENEYMGPTLFFLFVRKSCD